MDTKDKITRTALRLFLEKGYERTSLNDIAQEVGITKPAIYHHFKNKDQLFHQVLTLFFEEMGKWSSSRLGSCRNLKDLLKTLLESLKAFHEVTGIILGQHQRKTPYSFLELFLAASKKDPRIQKRIENGFIITRRFLKEKLQEAQKKGEIRNDVDCETLSFEIHALIEGTGLISYLDRSVNIEIMGEKMFNNIWKMLRR
ncbi:MAG TPA: TetR/AcrR family transcriptional regulator [candidate division Zixibacteria bacterium]